MREADAESKTPPGCRLHRQSLLGHRDRVACVDGDDCCHQLDVGDCDPDHAQQSDGVIPENVRAAEAGVTISSESLCLLDDLVDRLSYIEPGSISHARSVGRSLAA